jgi:hypothetical protein
MVDTLNTVSSLKGARASVIEGCLFLAWLSPRSLPEGCVQPPTSRHYLERELGNV